MGILKVMTPKDGDRPLAWDKDDEKSVKKAEKEFYKLLKKGYRIYRVERKPTRTGTPVTEFDPYYDDEYIATSPMSGG